MSQTDYARGLRSANKFIGKIEKIPLMKPKAKKKAIDHCHEIADGKMYRAMARGNEKEADFNRGQAMGYGMWVHTGQKLGGGDP